VDTTAGLDDVEKRKFLTLLGLELQPFGRTARRQSLYRLRYCESTEHINTLCGQNAGGSYQTIQVAHIVTNMISKS
jgi:hypothetical protein